jgi:integrase
MAKTRTRGVHLQPDGTRHLDKVWHGERIHARLGQVSQEEAEACLIRKQRDVDAGREEQLRPGHERLFASGAKRYLSECKTKGVRTVDVIAYHILLLDPYVGSLTMADVCDQSFEEFKEDRLVAGKTPATVNRSLEVARTIMNRAARVWRAGGKPWLGAAPLIEMLDESGGRKPYPITWAEQAELLKPLPPHLQRMVTFAVNTGARDDNICGLLWSWERPVPELERSVFLIPAEEFKSKRPHVLVLNDVAWRIVEEARAIARNAAAGDDVDHVFVWRRERVKNVAQAPAMAWSAVDTINNSGYQTARTAAKLPQVRVHDLRHTYAQRLRDAGVAEEDRALLLGHAIQGMPQHYATATIARLVDAANKVSATRDRTTILRIVNS